MAAALHGRQRHDGGTELVVTTTTRTAEGNWEWSEHVWTWPGAGELRSVGQDSGEVDSEAQAAEYYRLDCADVVDPTTSDG